VPTLQFFPFGPGLHQENEDVLQNAGVPRAIENFVRTKNGRLEARKDYETLALTAQSGVSALRLYDLAELGERLLAFGRCTTSLQMDYANDATERIFELVEQPTHAWSRVPSGELGAGTLARRIGRVGRKLNSVDQVDIAAGGGLICLVYNTILNPNTPTVFTVAVMIIDPETDATINSFQISARGRPRVCFVSGSFFITVVDDSDGSIELYQFNSAAGSFLTQLTDLVTAGASIVAYDLAAALNTNTFWLASVRSNTTTQLRGCTSAGVINYTTAGPAVLGDAVTVLHHTSAGVDRLHVCIVRDTTLDVDLYTYLPPATVPAVSTPSLFTESVVQCGLAITEFGTLLISREVAFQTSMVAQAVSVTTHGVAQIWNATATRSNGKALSVRGRPLMPTAVMEDSGFFDVSTSSPPFFTHALMRTDDQVNALAFRAVCVTDRFLGHLLDRVHLPSVAFDSTTNLAYVVSTVEDEDRSASPAVLEIRVAGTDRRQTVVLGDVLYITGAIVQGFDGRQAAEAGGFLTRPTITNMVDSGSPPGTGDLDPFGIYQSIVVQEYRDTKGRRIQSAPSNLAEGQDAGSGIINVTFASGLTLRDLGATDSFTPDAVQSPPTNVTYRTLNTADGNGTFHIDISTPFRRSAIKTISTSALQQSDEDLSDNSILYTQGARGALSGPLEFVCPDPAGSICASADRVLTTQLVNDTQMQESRPLFTGEQAQWSDTLGFFRDVRNRMLACVRLDERRCLLSSTEIFECDGPGLDDNGIGDIGAARRLPSDVGLYGGVLGWRSIVEMSAGIMFQGLKNQIYLLPRGGVTPVAVGEQVEDTLDLYSDISAAVYMQEDQTVRFCCNGLAGTPQAGTSVILLFNVRFAEWFVEGPYAFTIRSAARVAGRFYLLNSAGNVLRQRTQDLPLAFVGRNWRGSWQHPHKPGMFGRVEAFWCYTVFRGNCRLRAVVRFDDGSTETHPWFDIVGLTDGQQVRKRFQFDQQKCESFQVDFELDAFQGQATRGLDFIYWAVESEPADVPNEVGPEDMT
jgi:hypothetical protein